ncbi:MAG: hypothetical protein J6W51_04745 [Fibrobacter sp.]|nr:hypothetical protein [Fibrobacter sp.]
MDFQDVWNKIVKKQNALFGKKEDVVQTMWVSVILPDYLGYDEESIVSELELENGSTDGIANVVLCKDGRETCIVVLCPFELSGGREQLYSYFKQMDQLSLGILVCDKLYAYDCQCELDSGEYPYVKIPFEQNNLDGADFVELFNAQNFDETRIKEWIARKNEERNLSEQNDNDFDNNVAKIKNEISCGLVKELLRKYFVDERNFSIEEFEKAYNERNQLAMTTIHSSRRPPHACVAEFKNWLVLQRYTFSAADGYASAVERIQEHQQDIGNDIDIWNASKETVQKLVRDYDGNGKYAKIGQERHSTVINGLKRYCDFLS